MFPGHGIIMLRERIEKVRELLSEVSHGSFCCLRYGLPYITVSDIVEQSLCEHKVILKYHSSSHKQRVRELRKLVSMLGRLFMANDTRKCTALSIPLAAVVEGVPIIGRPDLLIFVREKLAGIVWSRIGGDLTKVRPWERVRLYALGLLADYAGLGTRDTNLFLITAKDRKDIAKGLRIVLARLGCINTRIDSIEASVAIHRMVYDRDIALDYIGRFLTLWITERGPQGPFYPGLCKNCAMSSSCPVKPYND